MLLLWHGTARHGESMNSKRFRIYFHPNHEKCESRDETLKFAKQTYGFI